MKKTYLLALAVAAASMALGGCRGNDNSELAHHHHHDHAAHEHEGHEHEGHDHEDYDHEDHEHDHEGHDHDHEGHDHEGHSHAHEGGHTEASGDVITLQPAQAERFGVATAKAQLRQFGGSIKVSGMVAISADGTAVVTAPTAGVVTFARGVNVGSEVRAGSAIASVKGGNVSGANYDRVAHAELESAREVYERYSALYQKRMVTKSQLDEAKAAYDRASAAFSTAAASGAATSPISGMITAVNVASGQYVEAGQPIASVAKADAMTVTADLPLRYASALAGITDARVVDSATGRSVLVSEVGGRRLNSSSAGAARGYLPVVFSLPASAQLVAGTAVTVYLLGAEGSQQLVVPVSALYEQQGDFCVFVRLDEDCYRRVPVTVGESDGSDVVILSGLHAGDDVVYAGVTAVRLAGASGAIPAGHSHSH